MDYELDGASDEEDEEIAQNEELSVIVENENELEEDFKSEHGDSFGYGGDDAVSANESEGSSVLL